MTHTDKCTHCTCPCTVHSHTHTLAYADKHTHTLSTIIQLKSISAPKLLFEISLVRLHVCIEVWVSLRYVCVYTVFPYVCVYVVCGCTATIITIVNTHMSTYWSVYRWAMRYLRRLRASRICFTETTQWDELESSFRSPPGQDYWLLDGFTASIKCTSDYSTSNKNTYYFMYMFLFSRKENVF